MRGRRLSCNGVLWDVLPADALGDGGRIAGGGVDGGLLGGLVGGVLGMVIFRIIFYLCTLQPLHIGGCILMGLVGALMGQLGDLSFSAIKRQYGIKDYGTIFPGHGGVLDRFDSVLFVSPAYYLIITAVMA